MNAPRRKKLQKILEAIEELKSQLEDQQTDLEEINDDEQSAFCNIPETLSGSERYERAEAAATALEDAYDTLSDIVSSLEDLTNSIEEAIEA